MLRVVRGLASATAAAGPAAQLLGDAAVNMHFTRVCNFACRFCFHAAKTSTVLPREDLFRLLRAVREAGCVKINFAGGEPFLPRYHDLLGALVTYAKRDCGFPSVSVISNGSHMTPAWFDVHGRYLDIVGLSCDTASAEVNWRHGRVPAGAARPPTSAAHQPSAIAHRAATLARMYGCRFKVNTVVTALNKDEDLSPLINALAPDRWKIFQVLAVEGENTGAGRGPRQDMTGLPVSAAEFDAYVARNTEGLTPALRARDLVKPEDNRTMQRAYILIDEHGRFLDASSGSKTPSRPILDVGIDAAAADLLAGQGGGFDRPLFLARGGFYPDMWSREVNTERSRGCG
jgi:radical S-adenosyl methionine domain-containing protein 2